MPAVGMSTRKNWESSSLPVVDPTEYRSVLGRFPTGVTIMTARGANGVPVGVTANSFNTVSLDPPLILWSLALSAPSLSVFRSQDHFAVNLLACDQRDLALQFARPSEDKFAGAPLRDGLGGAPLIEGAMAHIECRVEHRYPGGDHEIIVGRILRMDGFERPPLVFHRGKFCDVLTPDA
jgi:3-hydroxy-9,10-secoandrosta-1,3,5(10)-triene-9,17-dione monooxygenase reductase component